METISNIRADQTAAGVFILLPVLNEIDNIAPLLDRIESNLSDRPYTIGIVDDGSTDGTLEYLEKRHQQPGHHLHLIRRRKTTKGSQRGGALHLLLRWGLDHTDHKIFIEMDGDLSHRPEELREGIKWICDMGYDVAIASKYVDGSSVVNRPLGRRLVSRICSMAVRMLLSSRIKDYSNGFRFYTRSAAQFIAQHQIVYASPIYLSEVLALWLRKGCHVKEFPSTYVGRNEGLSKLRISDLVNASLACFEISLRYHFTGFKLAQNEASIRVPILDHNSPQSR